MPGACMSEGDLSRTSCVYAPENQITLSGSKDYSGGYLIDHVAGSAERGDEGDQRYDIC